MMLNTLTSEECIAASLQALVGLSCRKRRKTPSFELLMHATIIVKETIQHPLAATVVTEGGFKKLLREALYKTKHMCHKTKQQKCMLAERCLAR